MDIDLQLDNLDNVDFDGLDVEHLYIDDVLVWEKKVLKGTLRTSDYQVGDVVLYDKKNDKKVVVDITKGSTSFPVADYNPLAVIVIPSSHDVYGTGEAGAMSLVDMNCDTPTTGGKSENGMAWGSPEKYVDGMAEYSQYVLIGKNTSPQNTIQSVNTCDSDATYACLPSDKFTGAVCPLDSNCKYYNNPSDADNDMYNALPSPFLTNGARCPLYSQTTSPSSLENYFSDFNGRDNTNKILAFRGIKDYSTWKPSNSSYMDYAAASCCDIFSILGTSQGSWYLPAIGELGYIMPKWGSLKVIMTIIANLWGSDCCFFFEENSDDYSNLTYWSSTVPSDRGYAAWIIDTRNGNARGHGKFIKYRVRAFIRIA